MATLYVGDPCWLQSNYYDHPIEETGSTTLRLIHRNQSNDWELEKRRKSTKRAFWHAGLLLIRELNKGEKETGAVLWVFLVLCHWFSFKCCFLTVLLSFLVWTGSLKIVWDGYDLEK